MAQRITRSFIDTNIPGAYFDTQVKSTPVGVASSGNIVIIGEASGGAAVEAIDSQNGDSLKDNSFTPDQADRVANQYISGPIVDAFRAISSPSADDNITGSANNVYIVKTNQGSKAQATVASAYGTLKDKNWGKDGNKYNYQITQSIEEEGPSQEGSTISSFGATLDGTEFTLRVDGGAEQIITLGTGSHADLSELLTELNSLLPAELEAVEGTATDSVKIQYTDDATANQKGWGKSFELIDSTTGDLAALGLSEALETSSAEPEVQIDINRQDTGTNETFLADAEIALTLGYDGDSATVDITDDELSTTVAGGSGADLTIDLSEHPTINDLATFINAQTGYSASVEPSSTSTSPADLDNVTGIGIAATGSGLESGRIKKANKNFKDAVDQSTTLDFESTAETGLPDAMTEVEFLSGGSRGATTSADIISAISDLEGIDVNFVVPLFSRDASDDIADGLTDSSSTYTIDAINAAIKSHVLKMSTAETKKHRSAILSFHGTFSEGRAKAGTLATSRVSLATQPSSQVNSTGVVTKFMPWHTAAIAAGMQAAGFYRSITNKFANIISFTDPSGFDSGNNGDVKQALNSGMLMLQKGVTGSKWIADQTTYGIDTNFVFNSIQAMYAADLVALDLTDSFQSRFTGKSLADVDASTALSFLAEKADEYKKQKLITASSDAPLGFKNASIEISGPIMELGVEIKLTTAILFIPINLRISQVQSQA